LIILLINICNDDGDLFIEVIFSKINLKVFDIT